MKVTHIITGLEVGGAELALKNIAEYSEKNSIFQNKVISLTRIGVVGRRLKAAGIEVDALDLRTFWDVLPVIYKLTKLIKKQNPDIVQTWMYHADLIGGIAAKFAGVKKIFWGIRCTDVLAGKGIARNTYYIMRLCSLLSGVIPSKIICVAQSALKAHKKLGYAPDKMCVIHNGCNSEVYNIDSKTRQEIRRQLNIPDRTLVIGSVGRFNEYKDHHNFIKAAAILAAANNNLIFLMIGKNITADNNLLMEWISATSFPDKFILLGERNDSNSLLNAMDIFCLHSRSEAFPNVVVEAMCTGLPCVVTNVGDSADIVGGFGIIVPPEDSEALASGLTKAIDIINSLPADELLPLKQQYRNHILKNYSINNAALQYKACYEGLKKNNEQLDVLHIITGLDVGGAEMALKNIVEYSEKNGIFRNMVISLTRAGIVGEALRTSGINVIQMNMNSFLDVPRVLFQLIKIIREQNPDIVQTWMYHSDLLGGIAARIAGKKKIFWSIHSTNILAGKGTSLSTYFVMRICALLSPILPTAIIYVANASENIHNAYGYKKDKARIIPNGCQMDCYRADKETGINIRKDLGIPFESVVIGSVGRFNDDKDHHNLVLAAQKLLTANSNLYFLLIGRDITYDNKQLMQWINSSPETSVKFILLGERNNMNQYFNAMDIFCLHSKREALPNVISEAMCCELPCVVTDVGDCANMIGSNGVVVPPENPALLAEGINKILAMPKEERAALGNKARLQAIENYSLEKTIEKYRNMYNSGN